MSEMIDGEDLEHKTSYLTPQMIHAIKMSQLQSQVSPSVRSATKRTNQAIDLIKYGQTVSILCMILV